MLRSSKNSLKLLQRKIIAATSVLAFRRSKSFGSAVELANTTQPV
jgi:hypothetical protein